MGGVGGCRRLPRIGTRRTGRPGRIPLGRSRSATNPQAMADLLRPMLGEAFAMPPSTREAECAAAWLCLQGFEAPTRGRPCSMVPRPEKRALGSRNSGAVGNIINAREGGSRSEKRLAHANASKQAAAAGCQRPEFFFSPQFFSRTFIPLSPAGPGAGLLEVSLPGSSRQAARERRGLGVAVRRGPSTLSKKHSFVMPYAGRCSWLCGNSATPLISMMVGRRKPHSARDHARRSANSPICAKRKAEIVHAASGPPTQSSAALGHRNSWSWTRRSGGAGMTKLADSCTTSCASGRSERLPLFAARPQRAGPAGGGAY